MDKCGRCSKTVYPTEKLTAIGKSWHKACFKCGTCNATIQLGTEQQHEGNIYCKRCHQANFGIGGYGYGGGGGSLSSHKWNTDVHDVPKGPAPVQSSQGSGGSKFCAQCGTARPPPPAKFCSSCGSTL